MASESKETRLNQKAALEVKYQKRQALLYEKGLNEKDTARDVLVKKLKAGLNKMAARLKAIDDKEKRTADLAAIKKELLAKPKEELQKAKKMELEPPAEAKPKKKKKKEEETSQR
jgi:hypothetical protein